MSKPPPWGAPTDKQYQYPTPYSPPPDDAPLGCKRVAGIGIAAVVFFVGFVCIVSQCGSAKGTESGLARTPAVPAQPRPEQVAAPEPTDSPPTKNADTEMTRAEATAMLAELHALERIGHEMAGIRFDDDLSVATQADMQGQRRCMDMQRSARTRLELVDARTSALPDTLVDLRLAAAELRSCLVCLKMADQNCEQARAALHDADRALPRVRW